MTGTAKLMGGSPTETVRLVLNRNSEPPHVLHREDCATIQHQVDGHLREELNGSGYSVLASYDDGTALVRTDEVERTYFSAMYVTLEDLPRLGRYRRCRTCVPDAPECPPPAEVTHKRAATLAASDVGRVTVDGVIARIEHTSTGTTVTLESGQLIALGEGETISFPKSRRRASSST